MATPDKTLVIHKYQNRRFYDKTRSRSVSQNDLYNLVCEGYDLQITDATSGRDITHAVLFQLILERDADKLAIFPAAILHQVIRTQHQFLGGVLDQFFHQAVEAQRKVQEQWARFMSSGAPFTPAGLPTSASEWTQALMQAFTPALATAPAPVEPPPAEEADDDQSLEELKQQFAELSRRLEALQKKKAEPR